MAKKARTNKEHSKKTTKDLIEKATELFGRNGYHETSLQLLLEELGLTKGALYHHFEDKKDLFRKVFINVFERMMDVANPENPQSADSWEKLFDDFKALAQFTIENNLVRIIVVDAPSVFEPTEWAELKEKYFFSSARGYFKDLSSQGYIDKEHIEPLTIMVVGSVNESMRRYWVSNDYKKIMSLIDMTKLMIHPFIRKTKPRTKRKKTKLRE